MQQPIQPNNVLVQTIKTEVFSRRAVKFFSIRFVVKRYYDFVLWAVAPS